MTAVGPPSAHGVRRHFPGVLSVLAILLFLSGLTRIGMGGAEVLAQPRPQAPVAEASDDVDPLDLLSSLRAREERLSRTEADLQERLRAMAQAEKELHRQMRALAEAEARLAQTLALSDQAAENDLTILTAVFENMKPAEAAALFEEMDTEFAAGFIARLRPDKAAEVMAGLAPRKAYAISAILAGRHSGVPRN